MSCQVNLQNVSNLSKSIPPRDLYLWHLGVAELVPEILSRVESNKRCAEKSNPFDTANTSNAYTSQSEPRKPLNAEALMLESVESSPAENGREREAQEHGVQKDKSANCGVGVLAEDHESD